MLLGTSSGASGALEEGDGIPSQGLQRGAARPGDASQGFLMGASFLASTYIRPTSAPMSSEHNYDVPSFPISHRNSVEGSGHVAHANTAQYEELYKESIQDPAGFWDKVRLCP